MNELPQIKEYGATPRARRSTKESLESVDPPEIIATKAYRNADFLNSEQARHIRILCEYEETKQRLESVPVSATVMFFGSARSKDHATHAVLVNEAQQIIAAGTPGREEVKEAEQALVRLASIEWMCDYMDKIRELSRRVTSWSVDRATKSTCGAVDQALPVYVCTGGGPGFMEAANRGAVDVEGGKSIGMGITLPFEAGLNPYVSPELAFEFHYFFTRKFWMSFHMKALVVAPGGMGTLDELFELLTLKQTGKIQNSFPVVLFGKAFWEGCINWQTLKEFGVCSPSDVDNLFFTDDVDEAFQFIVRALE